jgi:osmotically-inducible protein OsmY
MRPPTGAPAALLVLCWAVASGAGEEEKTRAPALSEVIVTARRVPSDEEITARVEAAMDADPWLYAAHVTVETENGVVHLRGHVSDAWDLRLLMRDARRIAGSKKVVNELDLTGYVIDGSNQ